MSFARWLDYLTNASKTSIISGKIRKVHYAFNDGVEMLEEYNMDTGILARRAWKKKSNILGINTNGDLFSEWDVEVGDPNVKTNDDELLLRESNTAPVITKRLTRHNIEWRIRNLPYPLETYNVSVSNTDNKKVIVVRTTNKKYFKEISVPEFIRCELLLQQSELTLQHQHNTLILSYHKPDLLIQMEQDTLRMLQDVKTETDDINSDLESD